MAKAWDDVIAAALEPLETTARPLRVLDVGTGSGNFAAAVAARGHQVIGIDLSDGMLQQAQQKISDQLQLQFQRGDAVAPNFPAQSFDVITNRYLLWTLRCPEEAFENWYNLLRPGGMLLAVDALWYPGGIDSGPGNDYFRSVYTDAMDALPLAQASTTKNIEEMLNESSFQDIAVAALPDLLEVEKVVGVAPDHKPNLHYTFTARR